MLEDIRKIIRAGGYDLADLLHRIDVLYAAEGTACVWDPSTYPAYWTDEGEMPEQPTDETD